MMLAQGPFKLDAPALLEAFFRLSRKWCDMQIPPLRHGALCCHTQFVSFIGSDSVSISL
jgi:hypothetical protein